MQPDWKGVCEDTIGQAHIVAGKDYVVLMANMFGAGYGTSPSHGKNWRQACWPFIMIWLSPLLRRSRVRRSAGQADKLGITDEQKPQVAIGAGGGFVLEQARAGAHFQSRCIVFHLMTTLIRSRHGMPCNIKGRVFAIYMPGSSHYSERTSWMPWSRNSQTQKSTGK